MLSKVRKGLTSKVAKNSIWIVSEKICQMFISLIISAFSARYLGPSNYGLLNYGASLVTIFLSISKLGLDGIVVKKLIDSREKNGEIIGTSLIMRVVSSLISILLIVITVLLLRPAESLILFITFLQSLALIFQVYEIFDLWFQSNLNSKYTSIAKMIAFIIVSIYKVILLVTSKSVIWFALSTSIDYFIILFVLIVMYKRNSGQKLTFSFLTAKMLLKQSYRFILANLMITIYMQIDKIMIGNILNDTELGLYSAATSICVMWGFIPIAIADSFRPTIYSAKKEKQSLYVNRLKKLYSIIFWLGFAFCLGISIFSKLILLILYGKDFMSATGTLIIVVWYALFAYLNYSREIWIVCEEKFKYSLYFSFLGMVFNILLNSILIPKYGINGAALATLISQFNVVIIVPLLFKETRISTKYIIESIRFKIE